MTDPTDPGQPVGSRSHTDAQEPDAAAEAEARLHAYVASTDVEPPADLSSRIAARVRTQSRGTEPRRFAASLRALDLPGMWSAFRQCAALIVHPGGRSLLLWAQALLVVVAVIGSFSIGGVAAVATTGRIIEVLSTPATAPGSSPAASRAPTSSPGAGGASAGPSVDELSPGSPGPTASPDAEPIESEGEDPSSLPLRPIADRKAKGSPNENANGRAHTAPQGRTNANAKAKGSPDENANDTAHTAPRDRTNAMAKAVPNGNVTSNAGSYVPGEVGSRISGRPEKP